MTQKRLQLLQFSDCHLLGDPHARLKGWDTYAMLNELLTFALSRQPQADLILLSGDLSQDGTAGSYKRLLELFRSIPVPVLALPGNHDNVMTMQAVFAGHITCDKRICMKNWQILLLDSTVAGQIGGYIAESELELLDKILCTSNSMPTLLALHHPPIPIGSSWMDAIGLANSNDLFDILKQHAHVKAIVFGHAHQTVESEYQSIHVLGAPSTCFQFMPKSDQFMLDDKPQGYRWLELWENGHISTGITRLQELPGGL